MAYRKNKTKSSMEFLESPEVVEISEPAEFISSLEPVEDEKTPEVSRVEEEFKESNLNIVAETAKPEQKDVAKPLTNKALPKKMPVRIHPVEGKYARPLRNIQKFKIK